MNGVIIIKKDQMGPSHSMDHWGPHTMANVLHICDCILKDAKDGDEVEVTVKGTLMEHDGMRFIAADTVDGEQVEDMPEDHMDPEEMNSMDSQDALEYFMSKLKG